MALRRQRNPFYSTMLLYTYISRFSVNPNYISRGKNSGKATAINFIPQPFLIPLFNFPHKRPSFAFTAESGYTTFAFVNRSAHSGSHAETGAFRTGVVSLPSDRSARFGNPAWPGFKTANFAAFGSWSGVLSKNAESLRDSDAHDARRCPEASRPRWAA